MTEPVYRKIEFDTDLRTVWRKLQSGWDWLGVDAEGEFVLGYPGRPPPDRAPRGVTVVESGAREGAHGVRVESPLGPSTTHWYATELRARAEFARIVEELRRRRRPRPALTLVQRIEAGGVVDEVFVVE